MLELKDIVSTYVDSLKPIEVRKTVPKVRKRAEVCIEMGGGPYEAVLKRRKIIAVEE